MGSLLDPDEILYPRLIREWLTDEENDFMNKERDWFFNFDYFPSTLEYEYGEISLTTSDIVMLRIANWPITGIPSTEEICEILIGKYLVCKAGNSENIGKYRRIRAAIPYIDIGGIGVNFISGVIKFELDDYFPVLPSGNFETTAENQSYFEIVEVDSVHSLDNVNCSGFYNSITDDKLNNMLEVYIKKEEKN